MFFPQVLLHRMTSLMVHANRRTFWVDRNLRKKPQQKFTSFLVLDFEATCQRDRQIEPQEIIEFPCIKVNAQTGETEDIFHQYVQPRIHPILTPFCTELTGIMQIALIELTRENEDDDVEVILIMREDEAGDDDEDVIDLTGEDKAVEDAAEDEDGEETDEDEEEEGTLPFKKNERLKYSKSRVFRTAHATLCSQDNTY